MHNFDYSSNTAADAATTATKTATTCTTTPTSTTITTTNARCMETFVYDGGEFWMHKINVH